MSDSLRIIFMGAGDIAIPALSVLLRSKEYDVSALVTQPDKPVGRKQVMTPPAIKRVAEEKGIEVLQPERVKEAFFLERLSALEPDIIVVMAYGQILSQSLLDIPKVACINLHASLLPKYRGAACIQAAIDAGDARTGITVMHVVRALDAGDVILRKEMEIGQEETGGGLHDRLAEMAPVALLEALELLAKGEATREIQNEAEVSYVSKLMRSDGEIDWAMSAVELERRVRAYDPWPGTSTSFVERKGRKKGKKRRLKVFPLIKVIEENGKRAAPGEVLRCDDRLYVACGNGVVELREVQPDGSRRMKVADFLRSAPLEIGDFLGG